MCIRDSIQPVQLGPADSLKAFLDVVPSGRPWFFWLGFDDTHFPWTQQGLLGAPDPAKLKVPGYLPDLPGVRSDLAKYIAEVEHMDIALSLIHIGRCRRAIKCRSRWSPHH